MTDKNNSIDIILAKTLTCHFCIQFKPIWDAAIDNNNIISKQVGGRKLNFNAFDMNDPTDKNNFMKKYTGLIEILEGYPTVYMQFKHDDKLKTVQVEHTSVNVRTGGGSSHTNDKTEEAAKRFLNNIVNAYKTLTSENKSVLLMFKMVGKMIMNLLDMVI
jgi:hypothetical protein